MTADEFSLRDYIEARFDSLERHIDTKFDAAVAAAEFGDKQNAATLQAMATTVTSNANSIDRLEDNQKALGKDVRVVQDKQLTSSTTVKVLLGLVGVLGIGNIMAMVERL